MIVAVDTNILLDVLRPNPEFVERSLQLLEQHGASASLVICDTVYAELSAHFSTPAAFDKFLHAVPAKLDTSNSVTLFQAGLAWKKYRLSGGTRERILPDFLIGAHASIQAAKLLSRDRGFYKKYFPRLEVMETA